MQVISGVTKVIAADTFERPIYAGNAIQTVKSRDGKKLVSIMTASFAAAGTGGSAAIESVAAPGASGKASFVSEEVAKIGPSGTRFGQDHRLGRPGPRLCGKFREVIEPLADKLGAAIGASRAAVDAGYAPNDWQVGQTGKVVATGRFTSRVAFPARSSISRA